MFGIIRIVKWIIGKSERYVNRLVRKEEKHMKGTKRIRGYAKRMLIPWLMVFPFIFGGCGKKQDKVTIHKKHYQEEILYEGSEKQGVVNGIWSIDGQPYTILCNLDQYRYLSTIYEIQDGKLVKAPIWDATLAAIEEEHGCFKYEAYYGQDGELYIMDHRKNNQEIQNVYVLWEDGTYRAITLPSLYDGRDMYSILSDRVGRFYVSCDYMLVEYNWSERKIEAGIDNIGVMNKVNWALGSDNLYELLNGQIHVYARDEYNKCLGTIAYDGILSDSDFMDAGADDYIVKPFAIEELKARLRALLRRPHAIENIEQIAYGNIVLNVTELRLSAGEEWVTLSKKEAGLLEYLIKVDCAGSLEGMIADIEVCLGETDFTILADLDGEDRQIGIDCCLELNIRIYQEEELELLGELYSPAATIQVEQEEFGYENLVVHNNAKIRIVERIQLGDNQPSILQICYIEGNVKLDEMRCMEDGVEVDGVIEVSMLYVSEDDHRPMNSMIGYIPFTYLVEAKKISPEDSYHIVPTLEQISCIMLGGDEIEVKAVVNLSIIAFSKNKGKAIVDMSIMPIDYEAMKKLPGIIGYIVKEDDTLWSIAKQYYTTIDSIRSINHLEKDELNKGQKLVIVKG